MGQMALMGEKALITIKARYMARSMKDQMTRVDKMWDYSGLGRWFYYGLDASRQVL